jgi:hypothetical protein
MSNALVVYEQFDNLQRAAVALKASGFFADIKSEAQAIVKVMAGAELGLPPFAAMSGIHIISGKPALGSNVIATLVKNDPRYDYRIKVSTDTECTLVWFENGQQVGEAGFTMKEAQAANLTGKATWKQYPSDMLFARAISRGARRFAPGIFGGSPVYTPDELGADTDEEGYIIDVTPEPAPASNGRKPAPPVEPEPVVEPAAGFEDILAMIDEFKTVTVGDVVSVIGHTGLYNAGPHVLNAIKLYPKFEGKAEPTPATKLTKPGAKALANWLIDRKREENAMQPVDVDAINDDLFGE